MGSVGKQTGSSGSAGSTETTATGGKLELSKDLVDKANQAGTMVDYGDATSREYERHVEEINNMDLTDEEKKKALEELHRLTEAQLAAEGNAGSPYGPGRGPARFDKNKTARNADKAVAAHDDTLSFMENLRKEQRNKQKAGAQQRLTDALTAAINNGDLSVTVDGKTYVRNSRRSKTFTLK